MLCRRMSSPTSTPAAPRARRPRLWTVILLLLAAAALALWFFRARLLERVATSLARSQAGLDVRLEGLELDGLSNARAQRVVASARGEDGVLRYAALEDVEIAIDASALWSRSVVVERIHARSATLRVDLRLAPDAADATSPTFTGFALAWPDSWPAIELDTVDAEIEAEAGRVVLREGRIALGQRPGSASLAIDAQSLLVARREPDAGQLEGPLVLRATLDGAMAEVLRARWGDVAEVRRGRVTTQADGGFDAQVEMETSIGSLDVQARSDTRAVRVRGALGEVDLRGVLSALGVDGSDFGGAWAARGSFVLPYDDPAGWTADAEILATAPRIAGRTADVVSGRFVASTDDYSATQVAVRDGSNSVDADLVRIPREADIGCEFLERATVLLEADLRDVQAVLGDAWHLPPDAPPHRVRLHGELADGWLQLESGHAEIGSSVLDLAALRLPLDAGASIVVLDPSTEIEVALRTPDSAELASLLLPADVADSIRLSGAVSGSVRLRSTTEGLSARAALIARSASVRGISVDELTLRAGFERGTLSIERLDARAGSTSITARGDVDVRERRFVALEVDADVPELHELGQALGLEATLPFGRARASARLDGPITAPEGTLTLDAEDVVLGNVRAAWLQLRAHGEGGAIVVDDLGALLPLAGTIHAAGRAEYASDGVWTADLRRLELAALEGSAELDHPAHLRFGPDAFELSDLSLAGGAGAIRAAGRVTDDDLCIDAAVDSARVGEILRAFGVDVPSSLRVNGRATVGLSGTANGLAADSVDGSIDLDLDVDVADLSDLKLPQGFRASGGGSAHLAIGGTWRDARGTLAVEAHELEVRDADGNARLSGARLDLRAGLAETITIEALSLQLPRTVRIDATGTIGAPLDLRALTVGVGEADALARIDAAALDIALNVDAPDLAPLGDAFEILRRTGGSLKATLVVTGTIGSAVPQGRILLREGAVKMSATLPAISAVEVDLELDGDHFSIVRATGAYGGGRVDMSGNVDISGEQPVLELDLQGQSVPILRSAEISVRSDVTVHVEGPWNRLTLTGKAGLHDARFEQRLDLERLRSMFASKPGASGGGALELPSIQDAPFATMRLELDVTSETPVRVRTPLLRAQVVTRLSIRGTGANPLLGGSLELEGGRIALPASKLDLTRGRIDFDPNDPGRARLDLTAEGRVSGYDVSARVTGTTDDPVIELSSIPPASQEDLALLLVAGRIPGTRGLALDEDRVVGEVASYLARDLAYEWFGDAGESFADRLELSTGGDVTQSGADTIEVRFRLTGPARGPGLAVYMRGERDVYDRVNMGVRFVLRTK